MHAIWEREEKQTGADHILTRNDNGVCAFKGISHVFFAMSCHLGFGVDVRQICSDARSVDDVVQRQMGDQVRLLEKKRERLTDSTGGTANDD